MPGRRRRPDAPGRALAAAGCECSDPAMLKENGDSNLVCTACGVVAHAATLVSLARQKTARRRRQDGHGRRLQRPPDSSARSTATASSRPTRRASVGSGSSCPRASARRSATGRTGAASARRTSAPYRRRPRGQAREPGASPAPEAARWPLHDHAPHALEAKGRKVATAVAMLWKHNAPGRDPRLERGVQVMIMPALEAAQAHARCCPVPACRCRFRLLDRSNNLLALVMSQLYLKHTSVQDHPGLTEQHLQQQIDALAPITVTGIGKSQMVETSAALSNVLGYTDIAGPWETYCLRTPHQAPSPPQRSSAPSPLQLPPPALAHNASMDSLDGSFPPFSPHSPSSAASPTLGLSTPPPPPPLLGPTPAAVRQPIGHAAKWSGCSTSVHADALTALGGTALRTHLRARRRRRPRTCSRCSSCAPCSTPTPSPSRPPPSSRTSARCAASWPSPTLAEASGAHRAADHGAVDRAPRAPAEPAVLLVVPLDAARDAGARGPRAGARVGGSIGRRGRGGRGGRRGASGRPDQWHDAVLTAARSSAHAKKPTDAQRTGAHGGRRAGLRVSPFGHACAQCLPSLRLPSSEWSSVCGGGAPENFRVGYSLLRAHHSL